MRVKELMRALIAFLGTSDLKELEEWCIEFLEEKGYSVEDVEEEL